MGDEWPPLEISTDASFCGFGAASHLSFSVGTSSPSKSSPAGLGKIPSPIESSADKNINVLDLGAVCIPLLVWAKFLSGKKVTIISNNTQALALVNRETTKNPEALNCRSLLLRLV